MILEGLVVGMFQSNCYIVGCEATREAMVVDPGDEGDRIFEGPGTSRSADEADRLSPTLTSTTSPRSRRSLKRPAPRSLCIGTPTSRRMANPRLLRLLIGSVPIRCRNRTCS